MKREEARSQACQDIANWILEHRWWDIAAEPIELQREYVAIARMCLRRDGHTLEGANNIIADALGCDPLSILQ